MKIWERQRKLTDEAIPKMLTEEEQTWDEMTNIEKSVDFYLRLLWHSNVPGSFAPESIMTAAVQAIENRGYLVDEAESLVEQGLAAYDADDNLALQKISANLWRNIRNAKKNEQHPCWSYKYYRSWEDYETDVAFPKAVELPYDQHTLEEKTYAGWLSQIIGGAMGTAVEGYTTEQIKKHLGEVRDYARKPNTFNDDITYELALLFAYEEKGAAITADDIALAWIAYVPSGWSAEEIALRNIKYGIFPPESGKEGNPFSEWIGAQMRGAICGQLAPGNPKEAARLAWMDGCVSHENNGIIGEVFNAILVSLSYIEDDIRKILDDTINMIPKQSEYYSVIDFAYQQCESNDNWEDAWKACEKKLEKYNWIHAYPNAAAEVVALYYGNGDFDETMYLIAMCGQDVDCSAAQIMTALGTIIGHEKIDKRWTEPIGDRLDTYLRKEKVLSIRELAKRTANCVK